MFEITIKNLETGEVREPVEAEEFLLTAFFSDTEHQDGLYMEGSIENLSNALAWDGEVRAACRLAVAKYDAMKDVESYHRRKEEEKEIERLLQRMNAQ